MQLGIGKIVLLQLICLFISILAYSQDRNVPSAKTDSIPLPKISGKKVTKNKSLDINNVSKDSITAKDTLKLKKPKSNATKAAIRSAIIPGWGQVYNKRYWKIPIVYGALAIPVATFSYNLKWYQKTREAYKIRYTKDTANFVNIDPQLLPLSTGSLKIYRNQFRQDMDNSILGLLALWGLQIAEAAADAHLKEFNINDDLSMKIRPTFIPISRAAGINLVIQFRNNRQHKIKEPI